MSKTSWNAFMGFGSTPAPEPEPVTRCIHSDGFHMDHTRGIRTCEDCGEPEPKPQGVVLKDLPLKRDYISPSKPHINLRSPLGRCQRMP